MPLCLCPCLSSRYKSAASSQSVPKSRRMKTAVLMLLLLLPLCSGKTSLTSLTHFLTTGQKPHLTDEAHWPHSSLLFQLRTFTSSVWASTSWWSKTWCCSAEVRSNRPATPEVRSTCVCFLWRPTGTVQSKDYNISQHTLFFFFFFLQKHRLKIYVNSTKNTNNTSPATN